MPFLELRDGYGYTYQCHTSDPDIAGAWLLEHVRKAVSANYSMPFWTLRVMPQYVYVGDKQIPDWPVGGAYTNAEWQILTERMDEFKKVLEDFLGKS